MAQPPLFRPVGLGEATMASLFPGGAPPVASLPKLPSVPSLPVLPAGTAGNGLPLRPMGSAASSFAGAGGASTFSGAASPPAKVPDGQLNPILLEIRSGIAAQDKDAVRKAVAKADQANVTIDANVRTMLQQWLGEAPPILSKAAMAQPSSLPGVSPPSAAVSVSAALNTATPKISGAVPQAPQSIMPTAAMTAAAPNVPLRPAAPADGAGFRPVVSSALPPPLPVPSATPAPSAAASSSRAQASSSTGTHPVLLEIRAAIVAQDKEGVKKAVAAADQANVAIEPHVRTMLQEWLGVDAMPRSARSSTSSEVSSSQPSGQDQPLPEPGPGPVAPVNRAEVPLLAFAQLAQPAQPALLAQPAEPAQLTQPAQLAQLAQPAQPAQPAQLVQTAQFVQPAPPDATALEAEVKQPKAAAPIPSEPPAEPPKKRPSPAVIVSKPVLRGQPQPPEEEDMDKMFAELAGMVGDLEDPASPPAPADEGPPPLPPEDAAPPPPESPPSPEAPQPPSPKRPIGRGRGRGKPPPPADDAPAGRGRGRGRQQPSTGDAPPPSLQSVVPAAPSEPAPPEPTEPPAKKQHLEWTTEEKPTAPAAPAKEAWEYMQGRENSAWGTGNFFDFNAF